MSIPALLSDDQIAAVDRAAAALQPGDQEAFVAAVYAHLDGQVVGAGSLFRALREAQREFLQARPLIHSGRPPRAPYHTVRRAR